MQEDCRGCPTDCPCCAAINAQGEKSVLNPEAATASRVRVFITTSDHERMWDTVGVSENVIEASWEAMVDSIEYYYNNYVIE